MTIRPDPIACPPRGMFRDEAARSQADDDYKTAEIILDALAKAHSMLTASPEGHPQPKIWVNFDSEELWRFNPDRLHH